MVYQRLLRLTRLQIFPASKPKPGSKSKQKLPSDYNGEEAASAANGIIADLAS